MRFIFAFAFVFMLFGNYGGAQAATIAGVWKGGGTVTLKSGQKERIRCRVTYSKEGKRYLVNVVCVSTAGKFKQSGGVVQVKGTNRYVGNLRNEELRLSGKIRVTVRGNKQTVTATSAEGTASVTLRRR